MQLGENASISPGIEVTILSEHNVDGLLSHNVLRVIKELRTLKNDRKEMKQDLVNQIMANNRYEMGDTKQMDNFTKTIIDNYMDFLND